jgi:acyl carrier protein
VPDDLNVRSRIREFLARLVKSRELSDDADIFASGFVSSLMALQLVSFVEREFGVTVLDEDLDLANFRSISRIAAFVGRKRAEAASAVAGGHG